MLCEVTRQKPQLTRLLFLGYVRLHLEVIVAVRIDPMSCEYELDLVVDSAKRKKRHILKS
jgi:hypothetical protein